MRASSIRRGIYRTSLPVLGECARVDMSAGDAAPYLERDMYVLLGFEPRFEQLPERGAQAGVGERPLWPDWH